MGARMSTIDAAAASLDSRLALVIDDDAKQRQFIESEPAVMDALAQMPSASTRRRARVFHGGLELKPSAKI
jgi:hypothetical protein